MFDIYGYDDESGDAEITPDSPSDITYVLDGLTDF